MTTALVVLAAFGTAAFSIWLALADARARGRADALAEQAAKQATVAAAQAAVVAEHREVKDAEARLDSGTF